MTWQRGIVIALVLACVGAWAANESQLAGVRLGMKREEVLDLLKEPTAKLIAQPPAKELSSPTGMTGAISDVSNALANMPGMSEADIPNSLIFVYRGQEFEIAPGGSASNSGGGGSTGSPADALMTPVSSGGDSSSAGAVQMPVWAYCVRALKLSLDQQEFIYKLNETYSLGVTISGRGAEAKVTDVVVCSFEPFTEYKDRKVNAPKQTINTYCPSLRRNLSAGTSKKVLIGSGFGEVLRKHKWPEVFLPFATEEVSRIIGPQTRNPRSKDVPVTLHAPGSSTAASMTAAPSGSNGSLDGDELPTGGEYIVTLTDGEDTSIHSGFSRNCLMLYLSDGVAITVVDYIVVRIQIGSGVVRPPEKPKPASAVSAGGGF
jgi:hypothetical protein